MQLMTLDETAQYLRISPHTVGQYAREGRIPCVKIGRRVLYDKQALDKWLLAGNSNLPKPQVDGDGRPGR
jgi:excisionase family DNA binding protein